MNYLYAHLLHVKWAFNTKEIWVDVARLNNIVNVVEVEIIVYLVSLIGKLFFSCSIFAELFWTKWSFWGADDFFLPLMHYDSLVCFCLFGKRNFRQRNIGKLTRPRLNKNRCIEGFNMYSYSSRMHTPRAQQISYTMSLLHLHLIMSFILFLANNFIKQYYVIYSKFA